ncbi:MULTISPECIES: heme oxygenase [Bacillus]|uniref:Heme-degrading monooxygenase n=1 Tax=Bacillus cereus TaxID=1396 RepID=A0A9X0G4W5_BACCE|nr:MULTISPECIES: heme oxygenase [Bacillus]MCO4215716.1 heme oxygenase [Bacillus sp. 10017]HCF31458.1 heme oxygenase [Bacillus sp. (in: firmicutes)]AKE18830.1 Heme-degrading cytoplasmic oxygenase IsdG [Bacillus cereus]ARO66101.1 Heme-degrading monooxygenase [Bacillus cereus]ASI74760.1 heme-degrading monooxygenase IsdG [Bacillus cereus]
MIIVTNTAKITKGNGHKLIERFNKVGKVETMPGFLGLEVLLTQNTVDYDEVTISTRWNAKEDFQGWTKSAAFKDAHSHQGGMPEYILDNNITYYDVKVVRMPMAAAQ